MTKSTGAHVGATAELRRATWNPRSIDGGAFSRLVQSLDRDPELLWSQPILAMCDGTIYAGNMRYQAAMKLGRPWRERRFGADGVPAVLEDLAVERAKERAVRDNAQRGEWIQQDLAEMLHDVGTRGVPLDILGFAPDELERLPGMASAAAKSDDDDFDPTPPTVPQTRTGHLLILGPHRLICGDSRDASTWQLLMEFGGATGTLADALWTDPPYGVDLAGVTLPSRGEADALAVPFVEQIEQVGWHLAQRLVWVKNAFVAGRADYHSQHEAIYYGWKPGAAARRLAPRS